jgi:hypothetical protein
MIRVNRNSKIYIACPAAFATGGPELLHQLAYNLKRHLHIDAEMFYFPENHPDPVHDSYKKYGNRHVKDIEDDNNNILIVPEIGKGLSLFNRYGKIRKIIWWLSVDNFYNSDPGNITLFFGRLINKLYFFAAKKRVFDVSRIAQLQARADMKGGTLIKNAAVKQADFHLAQSFYAKRYLIEGGIDPQKVFYLSDYLNTDFLKTRVDPAKKLDIVAYNPLKGNYFTKKIMETAQDIKYIPLINMSRKQMIATLKSAKVYIDFGNHPGKDRIPREAAMLFCYVLTNKRGSAEFFEDVPLSAGYKFEDKNENIPKIVARIREFFDNSNGSNREFNNYRRSIAREPKKFLDDLKKIFGVSRR